MTGRVARLVGLVFLWLGVGAAALALSISYHVRLPLTRRVVAHAIGALVTEEIRGELVIGRIDRLELDRVVARHVILRDSDGVKVVVANRIEAVPNLGAFLADRTLRFDSARLDAGQVRLLPDRSTNPPDGNREERTASPPTLFAAFAPGRVRTSTGGPPITAVVNNIEVHDVSVRGDAYGLAGMRADRVAGRMQILAAGALELRIFSASARLTAPFPFTADITDVGGRIHTDPAEGVRLRAHAHLTRTDGSTLEDDLRVAIGIRTPPGVSAPRVDRTTPTGDERPSPDLDILVHADPVNAQALVDLGYEFARPLDGPVQGYFRLHGPGDDLAFRAHDLVTAGGEVSLWGELGGGGPLRISGETPGLALARVIPRAPELTIAGRARVEIERPAETVSITAADGDPQGTAVDGADAPSPRVHVELEPFLYDRIAVPTFRADAVIESDRVRIESIVAPYGGGTASGSGVVAFDGTIDVEVTARIPQIARDPNIRRFVPNAYGVLDTHLRIKSQAESREHIDLSGHVTLHNMRYGIVTAKRLTLNGFVRGHYLHPRAVLKVLGDELTVADYPVQKARFDLDGGPRDYRAQGKFRVDELRRLDFDAALIAEGGTYRADAQSIEVRSRGQSWTGSLEALVFDPGESIGAERLTLASGLQRLESSFSFQFRGPDHIIAELEDYDAAGLRALFGAAMPDIGGRIDTSLHMEGEIEQPIVHAEGGLRDGSFAGITGANLFYTVDYLDGALSGDVALDLGPRGALTLNGSGLLDTTAGSPTEAIENGTYDVRLTARDLDLELAEFLWPEVVMPAGRIEGNVAATGPAFAPSFTGDLRVPALTFQDWPALDVASSFSYDSGVLVARLIGKDEHGELIEGETALLVDVIHLAQNPAEAVATFEALPWRVSVRIPPRMVGELPTPLQERIPEELAPLRLALSGTFSGGALSTRGDVQAVASWDQDVSPLFCGRRVRPRVIVSGSLRSGQSQIEARAFFDGAPLLVAEFSAPTPIDQWLRDARVPAPPPTRVHAHAEGVALQSLLGICDHARGRVSADLLAQGLLTDQPSATFAIETPMATVFGMPVFSASARLRANSGSLSGTTRLDWATGESADIEFEAPLEWNAATISPEPVEDGAIVVQADFADAPILGLTRLLPSITDASGHLSGAVTAHGTVDDAQIHGELAVAEGYLEIEGLGQQLTDLEGSLLFHGDSMELEGLQARDGDGEARINGSIRFQGFRPSAARLRTDVERFPVRREGSILATLTGFAGINGELGEEQLNLELNVGQLTVELPDEGSRTLQSLDAHADVVIVGEERRTTVVRSPLPIHIVVDATKPFWVRSGQFAVQVVSELDVTYRDPRLFVAGYVDIRRGFFEVQGRRLAIDRGSMNFDGAADVNPEVNISASYRVPNTPSTTVTVTVTGRLRRPEIAFRSNDPDLTETDILTILVTGRRPRSREELNAGLDAQSEVGQQVGEFVSGLATAILTLTLRRELGDVLPVVTVDTTGGRLGWQLDDLIPDFLRGVVQGAYVEGRIAANDSTDPNAAATYGGGFLFELQWPRNIFTTFEWEQPSATSLDLTWEP